MGRKDIKACTLTSDMVRQVISMGTRENGRRKPRSINKADADKSTDGRGEIQSIKPAFVFGACQRGQN
jgi:hypothetical protein